MMLSEKTKLLRHTGIVSPGPIFDDALSVFDTSMDIDLLSNPNEIAAPKLMMKMADIYFTRVTKNAESTFSLFPRQMALWTSQREDHTFDWLRTVPISVLGQTMNGKTYHCVLCYRLGIPLYSVLKPCSTCSRVFAGDICGDHAVSCVGIIGIKHRHNVVRDTLVDICYHSGILVGKEVDIGLDGGVTNYYVQRIYVVALLKRIRKFSMAQDIGARAAVHIFNRIGFATGSSPLTQTGMVDFVPGRVVIDVAQRKRGKYMAKCAAIGYEFLPFSFSSLGELEADVVALLKRIRKFSMAQDIGARAAVHIFNRIVAVAVVRLSVHILGLVRKKLILGLVEGDRNSFVHMICGFSRGTKGVTLSLHAWYLDDGTIVGDTMVVGKVLELIMEDGPGLYFTMRTYPPRVCEFAQHSFDVALHSSLKRIVTTSGPEFGNWQWRLATLPFAFGGLGTKLLRHTGIVSPEPIFDDALSVFNTSIDIDLLSNPNEIAAPKLMMKMADIYFTRVTKNAESTFSLSPRQMALWTSQREDHTFDWLWTVPIFVLGQTMNGKTYHCVLCYRLGIPLYFVLKPCSTCSRVFAGDICGDHAVSCAGIIADMLIYSWDGGLDVCVDLSGSSPLTQTGMVDFVPGRVVIDVAQRKRGKYMANSSSKAKCAYIGLGEKEADIGFGGGRQKLFRPYDMWFYSWDEGSDVCVDLIGPSPLTQNGMVDFVSSCAVVEAAQRKRVKYEAKCADIGYGFLLFSFSSFGKLDKGAVTLLKWI
nr:hypothetical protein [Tanacetum cinerariifolium]